ncbi:MAG: hypothetical protein RLZZ450_4149 [Pseudomonadota bacterium]|jgi:signal transduction histidine kinase
MFRFWFILLSIVSTAAPQRVAEAQSCGSAAELRNASFALEAARSDPPRPPEDARFDGRAELPDRIGQRKPGSAGIAWYRLHVAKQAPGPLCGLYLPHAHANVVVYLNGEWLGQGGRFSEPAAHTWNRPLYFPFASERLAHADNVLDVGLQVNGGVFNALDTPMLGADDSLRPRFERAFLLRVSTAQASTWVSLAMLLVFVMLTVGLREATYGLFAIGALCYALTSLNYHWLEPPIASWAFNTLVNLGLMWMAAAMGLLGFLWVEARRPWMERATLAFSVVIGLAAIVLDGPTFDRWMIWGYLIVTTHCVAGLTVILCNRSRVHRVEWWIYLCTAAVLVPLGVHDMVLHVRLQSGAAGLSEAHLMSWFGPAMLLGAGTALLTRFLRVYRNARRTNAELSLELERHRSEITQQLTRVQELEQQRVVMSERERMTREMHDGVGGHLVAALASMEHGKVAAPEASRAVRDALDDVRLVVHALEPSAQDLTSLLADMRIRLEPRLRSQGLKFRWEVEDLPPLTRLGPFDVLQVLRIFQESVTNVLKHGRAASITVRSGSCAQAYPQSAAYIEIADDGGGFAPDMQPGRGIPNMTARAERIGATLTIGSSSRGTAVRLVIPDQVQV